MLTDKTKQDYKEKARPNIGRASSSTKKGKASRPSYSTAEGRNERKRLLKTGIERIERIRRKIRKQLKTEMSQQAGSGNAARQACSNGTMNFRAKNNDQILVVTETRGLIKQISINRIKNGKIELIKKDEVYDRIRRKQEQTSKSKEGKTNDAIKQITLYGHKANDKRRLQGVTMQTDSSRSKKKRRGVKAVPRACKNKYIKRGSLINKSVEKKILLAASWRACTAPTDSKTAK